VCRYLAGEDLDYVQLYEAGVSISGIGELMGASTSQIRRLLRAAGVQMRPQGAARIVLTDEQTAEAVRRYRQGETLDAIAKGLDCPVGAVREALVAAGLVIGSTPVQRDRDVWARRGREARRLYEQYGSVREVAYRMGHRHALVVQLLREAGVRLPQRRRRDWADTQERAEAALEAVKRYGDGATMGEIADQLGRSVDVVRRLLLAEGVELRRCGGRGKPRSRPRPEPDEYRERCQLAKRLYEALGSIDTVARWMGHGNAIVRRMLADAGADVPPRAPRQEWTGPEERAEVAQRAAQLYRDGATIAEAADQLGRKWHTIRKLLLAEGVNLRPSASRAKPQRGADGSEAPSGAPTDDEDQEVRKGGRFQ
jgi:predicted transcriptional regulator